MVEAQDAIAALQNRLRGLDPRQVFRQLGAYANGEGRLTVRGSPEQPPNFLETHPKEMRRPS